MLRQKANGALAPLTLLVGPNSTGKTTFLSAIRALWDTAFGESIPTFREFPYDLGSFQDIAHNRGARGSQASYFAAGFDFTPKQPADRDSIRLWATFENRDIAPFPVMRSIRSPEASVEILDAGAGKKQTRFRTGDGEWRDYSPPEGMVEPDDLFPIPLMLPRLLYAFPRGCRQNSGRVVNCWKWGECGRWG